MDFISLKFNIFIIAAVAVFYSCPAKYRSMAVIPALNAVFIMAFAKHVAQLLPIAFFLFLGFICIKTVQKFPTRKNIILSISAVLSLFLYLKKYYFMSFIPFIAQPYLIVGLSYILFRMLHILIDIYGGAIKERVSLLEFFNYNCFFLSFISGPIQRFQEFRKQERGQWRESLTQEGVFQSFSRIINGYLKIAILSAIFLFLHSEFAGRIEGVRYRMDIFKILILYMNACIFYSLYLYYNFAGYMDVVIGVGRFFGFKLPENFDRPFTSQSFLELWSRWHITLSSWFKFYVFNPIVKALTYFWPNPKFEPYYGVVGFFVTFTLMGIWHGPTPLFIIYGLFLGFGMGVNKFYEVELRKRLGKIRYTNMRNNRIYILINTGFTYSYFIICLSLVWMNPDKAKWLFEKIGIPGIFGLFVFGGLLSAAVMAGIKILVYLWNTACRRFYFVNRNFYFQQSSLALRALALFLFLVFKEYSVPEFVYKAF